MCVWMSEKREIDSMIIDSLLPVPWVDQTVDQMVDWMATGKGDNVCLGVRETNNIEND